MKRSGLDEADLELDLLDPQISKPGNFFVRDYMKGIVKSSPDVDEMYLVTPIAETTATFQKICFSKAAINADGIHLMFDMRGCHFGHTFYLIYIVNKILAYSGFSLLFKILVNINKNSKNF